jgi:branched-chain amino acid transport system permease protein
MINYLIHTIIYVSMFALLTLSLNIQFGLTGLINFGMMLFFAIGSYASAIVIFHDLPLWLIPLIAIGASILAALIVSLPTRHMRQDYWALITFGAQEVFRLVMLNENEIAGGSIGTMGIPRVINNPAIFMFILLIILVLGYVMAERIRRSGFGRVIRTIREDEILAASLGRNVYKFQLQIMVLGAILAAIAYAHYVTFVSPEAFMPVETFFIWAMLILGGTGNNIGAVLGAAILQTISISTRFVTQYTGLPGEIAGNLRIILFGLLLILIILYRPQGILPEKKIVYQPKQVRESKKAAGLSHVEN